MSDQVTNFLATLRDLLAKGQYEKVRKGCEAVLGQHPGHPEALALLAEATSFLEMQRAGAATSLNIEKKSCPGCGAALPTIGADVQTYACPACGTVLDFADGSATERGRLNNQRFQEASILSLGLEGTIDGKRVQVIGRMCFESKIREWDSEDQRYYSEDWNFDEWQLVTEHKEYLFIEQDREGYRIFQKFMPTNPGLPQAGQRTVVLENGERLSVTEEGSTRLVHFEGEFTWKPKLGDRSEYIDAINGRRLYAVEWRKSKDGTVEEVEYFRGRVLTRLELLRAFNKKEELAAEERKENFEASVRKASTMFFVAAAILFCLLIGSAREPRKTVFTQTVSIADISDEGVLLGPFQLAQKGEIYRMRLSSSIPDNSSTWGAAELVDSTFSAVNALEGDFWRESGYDDGHWSESDLSSTMHFRLENPGDYYVRFFLEKGTATSGTLSVDIAEGIELSRYYLIGFILSLGYAATLFHYKRLNPFLIGVAVLTLGLFLLSRMGDDDD